ncbi:unnamed protein product [Adineta steineri]|uniref:F-box domain-containing protein n=1 Tax=Adineta steineri TaxID=433720 RepID=A0A819D1B7_9BILA|nr:unnamed protein product [Adineta steineri]CAF3821348.1 unnamed protein product [Adineta steineri]
MYLELLPNELLLNLFEYFNSFYLFRAFYNLNSRFNTLLIEYFRIHKFDFHYLAKEEFEFTRREYLPLISHRIVALYLSNTDETPYQIDLFLENNLTLPQFIHLRSLSFHYVCSNELLNKILLQCYDLPHLTCFRLIECYFEHYDISHYDTFNYLWSLPKLTHCVLDFRFQRYNRISLPALVSQSIKYLSIPYIHWQWNDFIDLLGSIPNILRLDIRLPDCVTSIQIKSPIQFISALEIFVSNSSTLLFNLSQNMTNLSCLIVKTTGIIIDGHQWKQNFVNYLSKLKIFRCFMSCELSYNTDKEKTVDSLFDSYRSSYWIEDHQWFIRCQWSPSDTEKLISLYTLPDRSDYSIIQPSSYTLLTKSTCPFEYDYDNDNIPAMIHFAFKHTYMYFSYIRNLHLILPLADLLLSNLPQLNRLIHLQVGCSPFIDANTAVYQLQKLIDQAPYLYSLEILTWFPSDIQEIPLNLFSHSIRSLNFQNVSCDINRNNISWFNDHKCFLFINSSLGIQCEFLSLIVEKRTNIIDLVNGLPNLRTLKVHSKDDRCEYYSDKPSIEDELILWLQARLSCLINRDMRFTKFIRLWIR